MSVHIPPVDLSGAIIGSTGTLKLPPSGFTPATGDIQERSQLRILNESGCWLLVRTQSEKKEVNVPAGNWPLISISPTETGLDYEVLAVIPNAPVTLLGGTLYAPGEPIDDIGPLGNSPIGGGVSGNNTFSSESLPIGTQVIDIGFPGHPAIITVSNSGNITWNVWDSIHNRLVAVFTIPGALSLLNPTGQVFNSGVKFQSFLQADGGIGPALADISLNGSTSGQVQLFQVLRGNDKRVLIIISANWNSTLQTMALPVPFLSPRAQIRASGNMAPTRYLAAGAAQTVDVVSALNAATGAETTVATTTPPASFGWRGSMVTAFDTIEMSATGAVGPAIIIIEGN